MKEKLRREEQIINVETNVYQLEYIDPKDYNKEELEYLYQLITNKIKNSNNTGLAYYINKVRRNFQNKIRQRLSKIKIKENLDKLKFETNNSYIAFKILFDYYENKTKLATTKLTWENIWKNEELNSLKLIFIPSFPTEIENPIAYLISRMKVAEGLNEYGLNATNEEELKKQFLDYHNRMEKYYKSESEDIDDFQDDDHFDNFGEPFYETD